MSEPIDRPAKKPEAADLPVLDAVMLLKRVMAGEIGQDSLAEAVTRPSLATWVGQLAEGSPADQQTRHSRWKRLGLLWRKPHYEACAMCRRPPMPADEHAEVVLIAVHPDDVGIGFEIPREVERIALPGVAVHVLQIEGRWRVHLVQDISHFLDPEQGGPA